MTIRTRFITFFVAAVLLTPLVIRAQEGPVATQALVALDSKSNVTLDQQQVTLKVGNKATPLIGWKPALASGGVQVAILMDDGLRESVGRQIDDLKAFILKMPAGMQVYLGYMQNGRVLTEQNFTTEHAAAAAKVRLPQGVPGMSASPYFCLSSFVNQWPLGPQARIVLMITNGVDPYNGSDSVLNQDSPNVKNAQEDAQRAGVAVYSIYYADAGLAMRGPVASNSGHNYLAQVAEATGGISYSQGEYSPVSMTPFLNEFQTAISETYVASFMATANRGKLVSLKVGTSAPKVKLRTADSIVPGNVEGSAAQ
jgi:hypothetical protein